MLNGIKQFKEKLYFLITIKDKKDIRNVLLLGFVVGLFELIGLALIVLMIQIFTNLEIVSSNKVLNFIYEILANKNIELFVGIVAGSIFIFYTLKLVLSILNAKMMAKLTSNLYIDISKKLFENYLNYYYRDFGKKNTAEINQMLLIESDNLALMVSNTIYLIIHLMIISMLYAYMVYIDYLLTSIVTVIIIFLGYLYKTFLNNKLTIMGNKRIDAVNTYMKLIKSTFANYKFIKGIDNDYIENNLSKSTVNYKKTRVDMLYWAEIPRVFLEFIIITIMIGILVFIKLKYEETEDLLLVVSAYALALFRMLPSLSRVMSGVNIINMYKKTLDMVHIEFTQEIENIKLDKKLVFNNLIELHKVSYEYEQGEKKALDNISLFIKQGDKIAIVGESGSGKSTLMDTLIGLHLPSSGNFFIDDIEINDRDISSWRKIVSFVPQKVVLFESNVKENITFGKEYNEKLFKEVLEDVFMYDIVMSKGGIEAKVGDEVSGFSGGQMQRIAFARALYQERDIIFMDEATSSLDEEVEKQIIDRLLNKYKNKTIIAIVHKESIAKKYDKIIRLKDGKIVKE